MTRKNKSSKGEQMNPDQYIQKRARQLPLFECLVSPGWEVDRQPAVIVSRKHTNGNITACLYVVDLLCLGVIFTTHVFNVSEEEYKELVLGIFKDSEQAPSDTDDIPREPFERIPYILAHNIIYAGYEYAADFDIPPHKDFRVTRYMLEEDNEEIELMDIDCGHNGKPLFVTENLTEYSAFKPEFIIKKLNQHAGEENYEVISSLDFFDPDNDYDEYDFENVPEGYIAPDDYTPEDFEEDKKFLAAFLANMTEEKTEDEEVSGEDRFQMVVMRMAFHLASEEKVQEVYQELFDDEEITVDHDWVPDEVLPFKEMDGQMEDKIEDLVDDIFSDDPLQMDASLKELHELVPNQPFVAFLELVALHISNPKNKAIKKVLKKYTQLYPDDNVIKLFALYWRVLNSKDISFLSREQLKLQTWFSGRRFLHSTEAMIYCTFLTIVLQQKDSLEDLLALNIFKLDIGLPQEIHQSLIGMVMIGLTRIVMERTLEDEAKSGI